MVFFRLGTPVLIIVLVAVLAVFAVGGALVGRALRSRRDAHETSFGAVQGALLGLVGLLLAFGLTMGVGRYEGRRALLVQEADDIGTTYLRAQTLPEPARTESLDQLRTYTDLAKIGRAHV